MFNGDKSLSNLKNRATPASIIQKPFDSPEEDVVVLLKNFVFQLERENDNNN